MSKENKESRHPGFWKAHSVSWRASGMTQQAYCEQAGISFPSFVYQHNRFSRKPKQVPLHFIEAKPEAVGKNNQTTGIQLLLANGIRVGISNDVNLQLLRGVIEIIRSI